MKLVLYVMVIVIVIAAIYFYLKPSKPQITAPAKLPVTISPDYEPQGNSMEELYADALTKAKKYIDDSSLLPVQKDALKNIVVGLQLDLEKGKLDFRRSTIENSVSTGKSMTGLILDKCNADWFKTYNTVSPLKVQGLVGYPKQPTAIIPITRQG